VPVVRAPESCFDTPDLLDAKTLLDELSASSTIGRHDVTVSTRDPASRA